MAASMQQTWQPAYIGVGGNMGDPQAQVLRGIEALGALPGVRVIERSPFYRTAPLGPQDQPHFVNAVVGALTTLDPQALLQALKSLERTMGRAQPAVRWGPRVIDFDLLVVGAQKIATEQLTLPHPGIADRAFVLRPLLDIAPDLDVPGVGRVRALAERVDMKGVAAL